MRTERATVPYMVAANPVNYGKRPLFELLRFSCAYAIQRTAFKLTCVEAIAAALAITGHTAQAEKLLSKFGWGDSFWALNRCAYDRRSVLYGGVYDHGCTEDIWNGI